MTSRWPYWCPETIKRRPCWCPKPVLWELNSFLMQTLSFVPVNLHRCWPREWNTLLLFCCSRCRRRRRCLSSLSLKRLCHGCLLHFVTIVTRIRLIKACIPLGRISDRTPETAKTERGYFLIYIVYLLSSVFNVFFFCFQFRTGFCFVFTVVFLLIFQFSGFMERLRMILPQAWNHIPTKCEWCDTIGLVSICERRNDPKGQ